MNTFTFRGEAAEVRWGYHPAATLESWEYQPTPDGATVTARVGSADTFRLSQPALTFVVPRPRGPWVWPVRSLQQVGPTIVLSVGPQEG
jgi:hypothetical protein